MVMRKGLGSLRRSAARRVGVATAKARLSQILRDLDASPVVIQSRGRDVGVLVDVATYERIVEAAAPTGGAAFLAEVDGLRQRFGGGVEFAPEKAVIETRDPFGPRRSR